MCTVVSFVRMAFGMMLGAVVTIFFAALILATTFCLFPFRFRVQLLHHELRIWAHCVRGVIDRLCAVRVQHRALSMLGEKVKAGEVVLCIANHPSVFTAALVPDFLYACVADRIVVIAKQELRYHPFVGLPLFCARAGVFIARDREHYSSVRTASDLAWACGDGGCAVILFPDMRRPSRDRIARDRAEGRTIPGIDADHQYTLAPRRRALFDTLEALLRLGVRVRVLDMTIGATGDDSSWLSSFSLGGESVYVEVQEVPVPDLLQLHRFLNRLWKHKNKRLHAWKSAASLKP